MKVNGDPGCQALTKKHQKAVNITCMLYSFIHCLEEWSVQSTCCLLFFPKEEINIFIPGLELHKCE